MFYAHFVLAKKGPLARIWLAAHWDKKLTKAHVYETNIESSVEGIMQPKVKMALRTSGHLLLGVVRIYSRKAKYLLADCNEAFVKIKMAFRPGMVDLPEDKREAAMNAITLPDVFHDFDTAMPDLDDVDINAQFSLNQTRAEEITMREDYGNITLTTGDDGFGDSMGQLEMEPRTPEMLRDASAHHEHFGTIGGEDINLDEETADLRKLREMSDAAAAGSSSFGGVTPSVTDNLQLDAPIQDDGFGGVGLVQDILSGGLFEGGSLFDDPVPGGTDSIRIPPSERTGFEDDDFPGIPSPMHSDGSRPGTPIDNMSMNGDAIAPVPQLDATPVPPSPAHSIASNHSYRAPSVQGSIHGSVHGSVHGSIQGDKTPQHETTTLLHNEEESFALAPVEASALKGVRRQRKRKLIVDEIKAITGEGMKAQLSDSADIVTTLDIAPPTKRLMHWKETGGVDELFNLPGRRIRARIIIVDYQNNLKAKSVADELFDTLPGGLVTEDLHLDRVGANDYDDDVMPSPKKRTAPKRKLPDPVKSAYAKRQEELARQQEEFAKQEKRVREEQEALQQQQSLVQDQEQERAADPNISLPAPEVSLPGQEPWATPGFSTNAPGFQTPAYDQGQSFGQLGNATPAYSNYAPSMGYPTPAHEPAYMTPAHQATYQTPLHESSFPAPPASNLTPGEQASLTEQWVNQVQTDPSMMSPPHAPIMSPPHPAASIPQEDNSPTKQSISSNQAQALDFGWDDEPEPIPEPVPQQPKETEAAQIPEEEEEDEEDYYEDEEDQKQKTRGEDDMQEDETIEEFEDRVLNKRAAQLHRHLSKKFSDRFSQMTRKNNRKQAAQKFHSLLVLQKMMALDVHQDSEPAYGEINIKKGPTWNTAAKCL